MNVTHVPLVCDGRLQDSARPFFILPLSFASRATDEATEGLLVVYCKGGSDVTREQSSDKLHMHVR